MIGHSSEIKVAHFSVVDDEIETIINDWLNNKSIEIIDVKFSMSISDRDFVSQALVFYKEG